MRYSSLLLICAVSMALAAPSVAGASVSFLRPNGTLANTGWAVTGAASASEALDDIVDPTDTPEPTDFINATTYAPVVELALDSTSLSGSTVQGASIWFFTPNAGKIRVEAKSGGQILGNDSSSTPGWHSVPVSLSGSQAQLDDIILVIKPVAYTGVRQVYSVFLKLQTAVAPPETTTVLRPNQTYSSPLPWTVIGATSADDALDDPVTELQSPDNTNRIAASSSSSTTEVGLTSTPVDGSVITSAQGWFYTPSAKGVRVEARSNGVSVGVSTSTSIGWHSLPLSLSRSQVQLDDLRLKFSPYYYASPVEVSAAFVRISIRKRPSEIYWGARIDGEPYGSPNDAPWDNPVWNTFEKHTNDKPVSVVAFGQPAPWRQAYAEEPINKAFARNAIPLLTMGTSEDLNPKELPEVDVRLADIYNNVPAVESALRSWAESVAKHGRPFFFRWNWEMNGTWFQWGEEAKSDPTAFVKAWRRFHDIAEESGATNISWVWCPNVLFAGSTSLASLYPGDAYVDWTCMDGYNWGGTQWTGFRSVFEATYSELLAIAPNKPIMIAETASDEDGGSKSGWIEDALDVQLPGSFPEIKALVWFNWDRDGRKWVIESTSGSQSAFATSISSPYFAPGTPGSLPASSPIDPLP